MSCKSLRTSASRAGLLVSVRSLAEASEVAGLPIDVIDFKEPLRGALAATDPRLWHQAATLAGRSDCRWSAALGEWDESVELAGEVPACFAYAKAGPAGVETLDRLTACWSELRSRLAPQVELVAVAYADHDEAGAPEPEAIFEAAAAAGMRTWLLDTFVKGGGDTLTRLGAGRLTELGRLAQRSAAQWVLAGSIQQHIALELLAQGIRPTLFGIRGAFCEGPRTGRIDRAKVADWLERVGKLGLLPNG